MLTISSTPSGATVEIDGTVVGKTPYRMTVPGGYFHKTHTVFGARLEHAMILRVSMEGYGSEQINMTDGPFEWTAITGRREGTYFLLRSNKFDVNLAAASVPRQGRSGEANGRAGPLAPAEAASDAADDANDDTSETGSVLVTSETEGAEIYADGSFVGQTPSTIRLTKGMHRIEVRAAGEQPWVRTLSVLRGSRIMLRANFGQPESGGGNGDNTDTKTKDSGP